MCLSEKFVSEFLFSGPTQMLPLFTAQIKSGFQFGKGFTIKQTFYIKRKPP